MSTRNKLPKGNNEQAKEVIRELVRMSTIRMATRRVAVEDRGRELGLPARTARSIAFEEPKAEITNDQLFTLESREAGVWLKLADWFLMQAEYCRARSELSRLRARQGELALSQQPRRQTPWLRSARGLRASA